MRLDEVLNTMRFDTRLQDWNLKNKVISEKDLKDHLSKLPDETSSVVRLQLEDESGNGADTSLHQ